MVGRNVLEVTKALCKKQPHNCNRCMSHPRKFHCYCNYFFWEKHWM
jgi:hypothetical protein